MFEGVLVDHIGIGNDSHGVFADSHLVSFNKSRRGHDLVQQMDFLLVINVEDDKGAHALDKHDLGMLAVGHHFCGCEVIDLKCLESSGGDREVGSAGAELCALGQGVDVNSFCLSPDDIEELIGGRDTGDLGIITALIGDFCHYFLPDEIIDVYNLALALKDDNIVIIPSFFVIEQG